MNSTLPDISGWTTDANEAIELALITPKAISEDGINLDQGNTFHPVFTYPIFGESEKIYGYKGLHIGLYFKSDNLLPLLQVKYDEKLDVDNIDSKYFGNKASAKDEDSEDDETNLDSTQTNDLSAILKEHLPKGKDWSSILYHCFNAKFKLSSYSLHQLTYLL